MKEEIFQFSANNYQCYFDGSFDNIPYNFGSANVVIITDENVAGLYAEKLKIFPSIIIPPGESFKQQSTVDYIIKKLIELNCDRTAFLIGVGGGVVTDIVGYVASVYMRGIKFGLVPTSILAMVDACVGGKTGIDVGIYKNMVGTVRHPEFLLYDYSFLNSLPESQWISGFAEIIKHASIRDENLFKQLEQNDISYYRSHGDQLSELIYRNVQIKYNIVSKDEFEKGDRKLLNFGHTIGHAIENIHHLPHGHAVSIGMVMAAKISGLINNFKETNRITKLLSNYNLTTSISFDKNEIWDTLLRDKKKSGDQMNFILLERIGYAVIKTIPLKDLSKIFYEL